MKSINRIHAVGGGLLPYGLAFLLVIIGSFKFFALEAEAIRPLVGSNVVAHWRNTLGWVLTLAVALTLFSSLAGS